MYRGISRVSLMLLAGALLAIASQGLTGCKPSSSAGDYAGINEEAPPTDTVLPDPEPGPILPPAETPEAPQSPATPELSPSMLMGLGSLPMGIAYLLWRRKKH